MSRDSAAGRRDDVAQNKMFKNNRAVGITRKMNFN